MSSDSGSWAGIALRRAEAAAAIRNNVIHRLIPFGTASRLGGVDGSVMRRIVSGDTRGMSIERLYLIVAALEEHVSGYWPPQVLEQNAERRRT